VDLEIWKGCYYLCASSYNISYQERLREMARRSLDNLHLPAQARGCKVPTPSRWNIGTDKSDPSLTILIKHIQSSSDESEEFFFAGLVSSHGLCAKHSPDGLGKWCR
jgi:hypothetical protein